ncbi:DUF3592 domain-containing protein [Ruminococcus sp.]|uniref:DUF3592 domain-containing protein n=1 Tax=Ruminococcus sp. TaxID=41978 RepID=UPI0025FD3B01|nr:DUF3592 domain-containing protein [Ruminococcus sp.]
MYISIGSFNGSNTKLTALIVAILFTLLGGIFLIVGIGFTVHQKNLEGRCTLEVEAVVTNILSKESESTDNNGGKRYTMVYSPVYQYYVDGREYISNNNAYSSNLNCSIGDIKNIFCNPDSPKEFYSPDDDAFSILSIVFCILGGVFMFFGILITVVYFRLKKKAQQDMSYAQSELCEENNYPYNE